jgi:2-dehydropantoate 2-reductase
MRIAVLGPGALGCLLTALLSQAGEEVFLVDYRPERVALLRREGIHLETLEGERRLIRVKSGLTEDAGPCDLAILAVKAHQTRSAAQFLPQLLAPGGLALTLQNGLGNLEALAAVVGRERLLAGVTFLGVTRKAEGKIIYAGPGAMYIGAPPGSQVSPKEVEAILALFRRAGLEAQARDDIQVVLWEKLMINVAINPLTALLRIKNGALLELPGAWELAVAAAAEAQAVARAGGVAVPGDPEAQVRQVCRATAANRSSMLQDILAGRETEIEALNGQVAARGAALGVPTPVNHLLTRLIKALSQSAAHPLD